MASNWKWYLDAACTQLAPENLVFTHPSDLSTTDLDEVRYLANIIDDPADSGLYKEEAYLDFDGTTALTPGTSQLQARVIDLDAGDAFPATDIKMALTQAGLDSAVGGADLSLGTEIISGVSNALPVWFRCTNAATTLSDTLAYEIHLNGRTGNVV